MCLPAVSPILLPSSGLIQELLHPSQIEEPRTTRSTPAGITAVLNTIITSFDINQITENIVLILWWKIILVLKEAFCYFKVCCWRLFAICCWRFFASSKFICFLFTFVYVTAFIKTEIKIWGVFIKQKCSFKIPLIWKNYERDSRHLNKNVNIFVYFAQLNMWGTDGSWEWAGRVLFGLPLLPQSLSASLWVCRWVL